MAAPMHDEVYMYWLSTLYKLGSRRQNQLLDYFGNARDVFNAPHALLRAVPGITENSVRVLTQDRDMAKVDYGLRAMEPMGIRYISRNHADFPYLLTEIPDPPVGLFCLGHLPPDDLPRVAMIGSRRCSDYGLSIARSFGVDLAKHGVAVVSGMARGIDSKAHDGALEGGGPTIAVLGCGLDKCYPPENRRLRDRIAQNGCVVAEYPPGAGAMPLHFPARNRIISGLCRVVVVVEAGKKSGTLITVEQALDQGRDVMSVPGNITGTYSEGTNALIKQGAEPAASYLDILQMLDIAPSIHVPGGVKKATAALHGKMPSAKSEEKKATPPTLTAEEAPIYALLSHDPIAFDELLVQTNSQPPTLQYLLTMLELKGAVQKFPGNRFAVK